jgi:hypothetical protein
MGHLPATTNIDVFGGKIRHIVGAGDDIGGQIGFNLADNPGKANEEGSASAPRTFPFGCEVEKRPNCERYSP